MPVTVELENNKRIVHVQLKDPVTITEINTLLITLYDLQHDYPYPLYTLADLSVVKQIPANLLRIQGHKFFAWEDVDKGHNAVVVRQSFVRKLAEVIIRLANLKQVRFFTNVEEARDFLEDMIAAHPVPTSKPTGAEKDASTSGK
ncbi:MAG: hypothetical protein OHK0046_49810 [Anaerolineae bacterium]